MILIYINLKTEIYIHIYDVKTKVKERKAKGKRRWTYEINSRKQSYEAYKSEQLALYNYRKCYKEVISQLIDKRTRSLHEHVVKTLYVATDLKKELDKTLIKEKKLSQLDVNMKFATNFEVNAILMKISDKYYQSDISAQPRTLNSGPGADVPYVCGC